MFGAVAILRCDGCQRELVIADEATRAESECWLVYVGAVFTVMRCPDCRATTT